MQKTHARPDEHDLPTIQYIQLRPGAYPIVKCLGDTLYRSSDHPPTALDDTFGHDNLDAAMSVLWACDIVIDDDTSVPIIIRTHTAVVIIVAYAIVHELCLSERGSQT